MRDSLSEARRLLVAAFLSLGEPVPDFLRGSSNCELYPTLAPELQADTLETPEENHRAVVIELAQYRLPE